MFRVTYDWLNEHRSSMADAQYVRILFLAANEGEERTDRAIRYLIKQGKPLTHDNVKQKVRENLPAESVTVHEPVADLVSYDSLLEAKYVS